MAGAIGVPCVAGSLAVQTACGTTVVMALVSYTLLYISSTRRTSTARDAGVEPFEPLRSAHVISLPAV